MYYDHHVHSHFSFDSTSAPEDTVRRAIEIGLKGVTFTEHFDTHPDEWAGCVYDDEKINDEHARLRDLFGDQIFIGKGIEVCYQPDQMGFVLDHITQWQFDVVMLSVHWAGGDSAHHKGYWDGLEPADGLGRYLSRVKEAVRWVRDLHAGQGKVFDVLGHLDWACRYAIRYFGVDPAGEFLDDLFEILQVCVDADLVPEANTSGYRSGLNRPMPGADAMREYARLGGKAMTVGSDTHKTEQIGTALSDAADMMKDAGLAGMAYFVQRKMNIIPFTA